jgi:hypothetical protein
MRSDAPETEDWDVVDRWTRRLGRWFVVGFPSWLLLLAAFNQELTGIPWVVGLALASALATIIVVFADRKLFGQGGRVGLGPFGRGIVTWVIVFFVLALGVGSGDRTGAVIFIIPFAVATVVAGGVELARRLLGRR